MNFIKHRFLIKDFSFTGLLSFFSRNTFVRTSFVRTSSIYEIYKVQGRIFVFLLKFVGQWRFHANYRDIIFSSGLCNSRRRNTEQRRLGERNKWHLRGSIYRFIWISRPLKTSLLLPIVCFPCGFSIQSLTPCRGCVSLLSSPLEEEQTTLLLTSLNVPWWKSLLYRPFFFSLSYHGQVLSKVLWLLLSRFFVEAVRNRRGGKEWERDEESGGRSFWLIVEWQRDLSKLQTQTGRA